MAGFELKILHLGMKYCGIVFLFCFQTSFGQADSTIYFKEIGWTIKLPSDFHVVDTTSQEWKRINIEDDDPIHRIDNGNTTDLITAFKGRCCLFSSNFTNGDRYSKESWENTDDSIKMELFKAYRSSEFNLDTTYSIVDLDGLNFKKFKIALRNGKVDFMWVSLLSAFIKGHYLLIFYNYDIDNVAAGDEILKMLNTSRFEK